MFKKPPTLVGGSSQKMETKVNHPNFLREITVVKAFKKNGHTFKEGDKIDQVQTPIGASRNWNLLYVNVADEVFGVNVKNVRQ